MRRLTDIKRILLFKPAFADAPILIRLLQRWLKGLKISGHEYSEIDRQLLKEHMRQQLVYSIDIDLITGRKG